MGRLFAGAVILSLPYLGKVLNMYTILIVPALDGNFSSQGRQM